MTLLARRSFLLQGIFFPIAGCRSTGTSIGFDVSPTIPALLISSRFGPPRCGDIFLIGEKRVHSVLNLRSQLLPGFAPTWVSRETLNDSARLIASGILTSEYATHEDFAVFVSPGASTSERIRDPFSALEVLNRPVEGQLYNRVAEQRLTVWKETLSNSIGRASLFPETFVGLCTSVLVRNSPRFQSTIDSKVSEALRSQIITRVMSSLNYEHDVPSTLAVAATFRKITRAAFGEMPTATFAFGEEEAIVLEV